MITTVTTTTVTTLAAAGSLGLIAVVALLLLLVNKEIISNINNDKVQRLSKSINVALVPLMLVFAVTATVKLAGIFA